MREAPQPFTVEELDILDDLANTRLRHPNWRGIDFTKDELKNLIQKINLHLVWELRKQRVKPWVASEEKEF